jgi:acyl carrier protein
MFEDLKQILMSKFQVDGAAIVPEAAIEDLELDSLDLVELGLELEGRFGLHISEDELAQARKVEDILELAESRSGTGQ